MSQHHDHNSVSQDSLVEKKRLAHVLDLGNGTLQVEGFRQHNLEDLGIVSGGTTLVAFPTF
jgi:hypothetical protein